MTGLFAQSVCNKFQDKLYLSFVDTTFTVSACSVGNSIHVLCADIISNHLLYLSVNNATSVMDCGCVSSVGGGCAVEYKMIF